MKALVSLAAAAAGYLYLRRSRPGAAQKLEGQAKRIVSALRRRGDTSAAGGFDQPAASAREPAAQWAEQ